MKTLQLLGFKIVYISRGQILAHQLSVSAPSGKTLRAMHSKAHGFTLELAENKTLCSPVRSLLQLG